MEDNSITDIQKDSRINRKKDNNKTYRVNENHTTFGKESAKKQRKYETRKIVNQFRGGSHDDYDEYEEYETFEKFGGR